MNFIWDRSVRAVYLKELRSETQHRGGLLTTLLVGLVMMTGLGFAANGDELSPKVVAGLIVAGLLFTSLLSVPRLYLVEEDQGTLPLLRMVASAESIYMGKLLFGLLQTILVNLFLSVMFVILMDATVHVWWTFLGAIVLESATFVATCSLAGILVLGASGRWMLVTVVAGSLLLPQTALAVHLLKFQVRTRWWPLLASRVFLCARWQSATYSPDPSWVAKPKNPARGTGQLQPSEPW
jgi:ABC-type transport system involved in cytochrome c biogenesis permease component